MIRQVIEDDAEIISTIYNYYVENTTITFEEDAISIAEMKQRIMDVSTQYPWLVYEYKGLVVAYAYADLWKSRCAYRYTLEVTIYGANDMPQRLGIGQKLYQTLFDELDTRMVHNLIAVITIPNEASAGLHEKMGFVKAGHFKEVGYKFDQWLDVGFWQKTL